VPDELSFSGPSIAHLLHCLISFSRLFYVTERQSDSAPLTHHWLGFSAVIPLQALKDRLAPIAGLIA